MAEKLSETTWTGFVKKQKLELDDKVLVKALSAFDKTDEAKPEPRLKALEEVIKQIPEQVKALVKRKKELGDKPFGEAKDKLYALLEEAEALQKKTQAAAAAAGADKKGDDDDEEADSPVLLTTKMVPLLRALKKGEVQMSALICTAGKNTAVLIMRRSIAASRRKLLAEAVDAKGGMKYIVGECKFENGALTFVVQSPASQLAKRIRQALLEQTEMRFKVKVRGDDGVEDDDGEDGGEEQPGVQQKQAAPPGGPASAEQIAYVQQLKKVRERYEQALKEQHPEATKLRAVMGYASEKADGQKDYAAASKALEQIEKLLGETTTSGQAQKEPGGVDAGVAFKARMTALIPKIKEAETAGHPSAPDAKRKASEAGVLAGKRDFVQANALLAQAEALLLGSAVGTAGQVPGSGGGADAAVAGPKARLAAGLARLAALADPKVEAALARVTANITSAIDAGDAGASLPQLARLEEVLEAAERRKAAASPIERNLVKYRTAHAEWLNAERLAVSTLQGFGKQVLSHPEIAGSANFPDVKQYVESLPTLVPAFGAELGTMLRSIEEAEADAARIAAVATSQDKIRSYREDLLSDSVLVGLEQFAAKNFGGLALLDNLRLALSRLEAVVKI